MNFIIELPVSSDACYPRSWHIWVVTDRLTKERHFVPCQDMTASHQAKMFIQCVLRAHGLPLSIVSDRGTQFTSQKHSLGILQNDTILCQQEIPLKAYLKPSSAKHQPRSSRPNPAYESYLRTI